jgi:hypothetical protein
MQEDFIALQEEFKDMKERFGEKLAALDRDFEEQQALTTSAEMRVICTEDLVRFYEEQRRHMAGHWKAQCQLKDERIRYLNLQLTEYTIDWQHLGTQKQTDASLSHELQCLRDRHGELQRHFERRAVSKECLTTRLAKSHAEAAELREVEAGMRTTAEAGIAEVAEAAEEAVAAEPAEPSEPAEIAAGAPIVTRMLSLLQLQVGSASLRGKVKLLQEMLQQQEKHDAQATEPPWPHTCIWRDELDVRERQLEKITAELDRSNNALHAAQAALALQRARHEEMKTKHREAESELREAEKRRTCWQRQCSELHRAEAELCRMMDAEAPTAGELAANASGFASAEAVPRDATLSSHAASGARGGSGRGGGRGSAFVAPRFGAPASGGSPTQHDAAQLGSARLRERLIAIDRERRRSNALRQEAHSERAGTMLEVGAVDGVATAEPS